MMLLFMEHTYMCFKFLFKDFLIWYSSNYVHFKLEYVHIDLKTIEGVELP